MENSAVNEFYPLRSFSNGARDLRFKECIRSGVTEGARGSHAGFSDLRVHSQIRTSRCPQIRGGANEEP